MMTTAAATLGALPPGSGHGEWDRVTAAARHYVGGLLVTRSPPSDSVIYLFLDRLEADGLTRATAPVTIAGDAGGNHPRLIPSAQQAKL
ncbi:MAG: hypothetical protein IPM88_20940 [Nitrospira sp.]|nr:hypothetical protein [Nitrospira sp.]